MDMIYGGKRNKLTVGKMWPIVLVSCYYISEGHNIHKKSMDQGRSFLNICLPKILFVDPSMVHEMNLFMLECAESDRSLLGMCRIVPMSLSSLMSPAVVKPFFIKTALDLAIFPCHQIGFMDFTISDIQSIPLGFEKMIHMALDNSHFRIMFLEYYEIRRTYIPVSVAKEIVRASEKVSTQFWFAPVDIMRTFVDRVIGIRQRLTNPDYDASDDNIFMMALYFNAELESAPLPCRPWLGARKDILTNIYTPRESLDKVCSHVRLCLSRSDHDHFGKIVGYVMTGLRAHPEIYKDSGALDNLVDGLVWGLYYQENSFIVFEVLSLICRYKMRTWSSLWPSIVSNFRYYWIRFRDELPFPVDSLKK